MTSSLEQRRYVKCERIPFHSVHRRLPWASVNVCTIDHSNWVVRSHAGVSGAIMVFKPNWKLTMECHLAWSQAKLLRDGPIQRAGTNSRGVVWKESVLNVNGVVGKLSVFRVACCEKRPSYPWEIDVFVRSYPGGLVILRVVSRAQMFFLVFSSTYTWTE